MKPNLTICRGTIPVAQLRANRSLRPDIIGEIHPELWGVIQPELWGEINRELRGNLSELWGNLSGLRGEIPAGARGNLDACELTDDERAAAVNIADLIASN